MMVPVFLIDHEPSLLVTVLANLGVPSELMTCSQRSDRLANEARTVRPSVSSRLLTMLMSPAVAEAVMVLLTLATSVTMV